MRSLVVPVVVIALMLIGCGQESKKPATEPAKKPAATSGDPKAPAADSKDAKPAADAPSLVFEKKPLAAGASYKQTSLADMAMEMVVVMGQQPNKVATHEKREEARTTTVLDTKDNAITKVEVHYDDQRTIKRDSGQAEAVEIKSPVMGKTYVVTATAEGTIEVTYKNGTAPVPDEVQIVRSHHNTLGKPDQFAQLLPDKPVTVGQKVEVPAGLIKNMMNINDEPMEIEEFAFTLKAITDVSNQLAGRFELVLKMSVKPGPGMKMVMDMRGDVVLLQSGLLSSFSLEGPARVELDDSLKGQVQANGGGQMSFSKSLTY